MIRKMNENEFDTIFYVMETSFPKDEYRPYDEQRELLNDERYSVYVLEDSESNSIKGFIALWELEGFVFIEHFAVNPNYRNGGIGSLILEAVKEMFSCPICLEVELPETDMAKRRIGFYERNGFFYNDYPYTQPPIAKGRNPIFLRIMTSGSGISQECFEHIRDVIYTEVYKCNNL